MHCAQPKLLHKNGRRQRDIAKQRTQDQRNQLRSLDKCRRDKPGGRGRRSAIAMPQAVRRQQKGNDAKQGHNEEYMVPARMAEDRGAGTIISVASAETDAARIRYKYILSMLNSSVNID